MFRNERIQRAARAIDHELFYQKNGFMAHADAFADPTSTSLDLAAAATLAADGELENLQALRSTREMWLDLALNDSLRANQITTRRR